MIKKWMKLLHTPDSTVAIELEKIRNTLDDQIRTYTVETASRLDKIEAGLEELTRSVAEVKSRQRTRAIDMAAQTAMYLFPPQLLILLLADMARRGVPLVPRHLDEWLAVVPIIFLAIFGFGLYIFARFTSESIPELKLSSRKLFFATAFPPVILVVLTLYGGLYLNPYVSITTFAMIVFFGVYELRSLFSFRKLVKSGASDLELGKHELGRTWASYGLLVTSLTFAWLWGLQHWR